MIPHHGEDSRCTGYGKLMSGHSILYLGRGEFAAEYLGELETLPCCTYLTRSKALELPEDASYIVDVILLEAGPVIALFLPGYTGSRSTRYWDGCENRSASRTE